MDKVKALKIKEFNIFNRLRRDFLKVCVALLKVIYTVTVLVIMFNFVDFKSEVYLFTLFCIWIYIAGSYGIVKNADYLKKCLAISFSFVIAYIINRVVNHKIVYVLSDIDMLLLVCNGIILIIVCGIIVYSTFKRTDVDGAKKELFECRFNDLDRIKALIKSVDIVGVNSGWGNGKTFLIEHLLNQKDIKEQFEVIQIDLLTCNLDEIEVRLMKELEKILNKHMIYSRSSKQLINILGDNKTFINLHSFMLDNQMTLAETFDGFKLDIKKLSKKVLIIFDDVDRINNKDNLIKLLGIAEKLAGEHVKVMYLYQQDNLKNIGIERDYIEKYIPYTTNLTEMNFEECLDSLWDELKMAEVNIDKEEMRGIAERLVYGTNHGLADDMDVSYLFESV